MVQVQRLGPQIGAEITGVDVRELDDAAFGVIYQAWLDHNVAVIPGQDLTIEQFLAYSRRFGHITPHPSKATRHPDLPEITLLGANKFNPDGTLNTAIYRRGAEGWHTDGAYDAVPFKATQLYALAIPSTGGDTLFANMYAAYDALPQRLRQRLHGVNGAFTYGGRRKRRCSTPRTATAPPSSTRSSAPTTKPAANRSISTPEKSSTSTAPPRRKRRPDRRLTGYMIQPEAENRHKWRVGDIVIWDNRCSVHKAAGDYPPEEDRIHWRVSIKDH